MDPALIRHELARILDHNLFARAATLRDIFTFLVDRAILKQSVDEQMIADQVLDIPASEFHPYRNANVRVQVRNLRLKLEAYYLVNPPDDIRFRCCAYEILFDKVEKISVDARRILNQARYLWDSHFPADLHYAVELVEQVLQRHPSWGLAWETMSSLQVGLASQGGGPPRKHLHLAGDAADKAIAFGPNSGHAYACKSVVVAFLDWNWIEAETHYQRALVLDPSVKYQSWCLAYLNATGRAQLAAQLLEESLCVIERPSPMTQTKLGITLYFCRRIDDAERELQRAHKLNPDEWTCLVWLAIVQWGKGDHLKAAANQTRAAMLARRSPPGQYFETASEGLTGTPRVAASKEQQGGITEIGVLLSAVILHQWTRAIDAMERMLDSRFPLAFFFLYAPFCDPLWKLQRFRDLVARVGLPEV